MECLRKLHIGCDEVVDPHILLNPRVGKVVRKCSDLACLVLFLSCIGAEFCLAQRHAVDVTHFGKGGPPVGFPFGPGVVSNDTTVPLLSCHSHVPHASACFVSVVTMVPWRWVQPG
jgi:hypothetical protein